MIPVFIEVLVLPDSQSTGFLMFKRFSPFSYHRYSSYSVLLLISPQKFRRSLSAYIKNI